VVQVADLVIDNARILTMDEAHPRGDALAVKDGEVLAVGNSAEIAQFKGPSTKVIDALGCTVLPGFNESHLHLFGGAFELSHLQLANVHGFEALRNAIRAHAAQRPQGEFLAAYAAGYDIIGEKPLTRHDLDTILPDQPIYVFASDHHVMWANTKALEKAGLLHGKKLGPGNEVVMGDDGLATGELREPEAYGPMMAAAEHTRPMLGMVMGGEPENLTPAQWEADIEIVRFGLAHCAKHGITSLQNMDGNLYQLELLAEIEKRGGLICRMQVPFHFKNFMKVEMLEKAEHMAKRYDSEWLSSGLVKAFMDGVIDGYTAVMLEPYADKPEATVEPLFTQAQFNEMAIEADRRGLQIAVHAIGDGAVRSVLNGYEAAQKANGKRDSRHRIEHVEVTTAQDIPRFAELGVIASIQPSHAPGAMDFPVEPTVSKIGEMRWPYSYAWRTLQKAGAKIAFSTDWPVSDINPLRSVQAAVTRKEWSAVNSAQAFSLHDTLKAYTWGGAYAEFMDHRKGVLKKGYLADIVMLSDDIEKTAPDQIGKLRPTLTICGGRVTYQS
jgi:predicted amidohydrolase YtcJ